MKKLFFWLLIAVILLNGLLLAAGLYNYKQAYICSQRTDMTDLDIVMCNQKFGFYLDWYEEPYLKDYILSSFRREW